MDLECFLQDLIRLRDYIDEFVICVIERQMIDREKLNYMMESMESVVPQWLFFVEQTGIGTMEFINQRLADLEYGITNNDVVYFADTLCNGVGNLIAQYINVITEVLYEDRNS